MSARKSKIWATIIAAVLANGCSDFSNPPDRYGLAIDPSLTDDQMQIVMNAAQEWVDRTGVTVQVSISDHKCGEDLLQASWGCISLRIADIKLFTPPAVGLTSEEPNPTQKIGFSSNVYIASSVTDPTAFYKDVRHELGHALGLYHEEGTVMDPWIHNAPARITCADVGQYNAVRHRVVPPCDVAINSPYEQPAVDSPPPSY